MKPNESYEQVWKKYLQLLNTNPKAIFKTFLREKKISERSIARWMVGHGLSVAGAKAAIKECQKSTDEESEGIATGAMFLPMTVSDSPTSAEVGDVLSGISLTFPDGTLVSIRRGSAKAVVAFLELYRKGGMSCLD